MTSTGVPIILCTGPATDVPRIIRNIPLNSATTADVLTALELQNSDAGQVQLHYGEFFDAKAVPVLHGRPVRQCDAIASDEASI